MQYQFGQEKERFKNIGDQFDCLICQNVVRDPKECDGCGNLFCKNCIDSWQQKSKQCPNKCDTSKKITEIKSAFLKKLQNNLEIKCVHCNTYKTIIEIEQHERVCAQPKCLNFDICQNNVKNELADKKVCDPSCLLLLKIKQSNNNYPAMLKEIKKFLKQYNYIQDKSNQVDKSGIVVWKWDTVNIGQGVEVSPDRKSVYLKEAAYMFRTVIGDTGFMSGVHYWEIIADDRTENELKTGITTKKDFNYNSAFCDYEHGYSFYGLGQLRHNSNASGPQYGKRFKKEGVLGVCLNMNKGQLSFSLNGEFLGVAYSNDQLKKGPIYPAVSLLHCAGCKMESGKVVPSIFPL